MSPTYSLQPPPVSSCAAAKPAPPDSAARGEDQPAGKATAETPWRKESTKPVIVRNDGSKEDAGLDAQLNPDGLKRIAKKQAANLSTVDNIKAARQRQCVPHKRHMGLNIDRDSMPEGSLCIDAGNRIMQSVDLKALLGASSTPLTSTER